MTAVVYTLTCVNVTTLEAKKRVLLIVCVLLLAQHGDQTVHSTQTSNASCLEGSAVTADSLERQLPLAIDMIPLWCKIYPPGRNVQGMSTSASREGCGFFTTNHCPQVPRARHLWTIETFHH